MNYSPQQDKPIRGLNKRVLLPEKIGKLKFLPHLLLAVPLQHRWTAPFQILPRIEGARKIKTLFHLYLTFIYNNLSIYIISKFIYLWLCRLSSGCGEQRLLSSCSVQASYCSGFLLQRTGFRAHRLQQLRHVGSAVVATRL